MNMETTVQCWPRLMRHNTACDYTGGRTNLQDLEAKFGLRPIRRHKGNTTYVKEMIDQAIDRAILEGWERPGSEFERPQTVRLIS